MTVTEEMPIGRRAFLTGMFVIGFFFGNPQLFYAIGCAYRNKAGDYVELTTREQQLAEDLARTLSVNRGGLWIMVGMVAVIVALLAERTSRF